MLNLPTIIIDLIDPFAGCFYGITTWKKAQVLLIGAILTPGKRVVTELLRVMGLRDCRQFAQYHQVLNRAVWSPLALAQVLLRLLVMTFVPADQPLVLGIDPTIERRWGHQIAARGIYRDAVRSSESHVVKVSGLRWISLMLLTPIPWAQRVWALPVMTVLSPSERYYQQRGRAPKTLLERSLQMLKVLRGIGDRLIRLPRQRLDRAGCLAEQIQELQTSWARDRLADSRKLLVDRVFKESSGHNQLIN